MYATACSFCNKKGKFYLSPEKVLVGNTTKLECDKCKKVYDTTII